MSRVLPAPLSGIYEARRPTGVIFGTLVPIVAIYGGLIGSAMVYLLLTGSGDMPAWMTVVAFGSIMLLLFVWLRFKDRRRFSTLGFTGGRGAVSRALRGAAFGVALVAVAVLLLSLFGQAEVRWNGAALGATDWLMALAWVAIYAVQASGEEAATRGFAMQAYARRLGVPVAIVLQAVLFAALHGQNDGMSILPMLNLLLVGVALGSWAVVDGNLWGVCAFHGAWNWSLSWLFGSAVSGQGGGGGIFAVDLNDTGLDFMTGGEFGLEGSALVTAILVAVIVCLVRPLRRAIRQAH